MKFYTKQHKYYCGIDLHASNYSGLHLWKRGIKGDFLPLTTGGLISVMLLFLIFIVP